MILAEAFWLRRTMMVAKLLLVIPSSHVGESAGPEPSQTTRFHKFLTGPDGSVITFSWTTDMPSGLDRPTLSTNNLEGTVAETT